MEHVTEILEPYADKVQEAVTKLTALQGFGAAVLTVGLIALAWFILTKPIKLLFKLITNTVLGFISLAVINYLGSFIGVSIGVNWINALIVGILGVPGVAVLFLVRWLMMV